MPTGKFAISGFRVFGNGNGAPPPTVKTFMVLRTEKDKRIGDFPVATYAPVTRGADRGTWYKVTTGAYVDRAKAEQLLTFLRQRGLVPNGWGTVVRAPYALQIGTAPSKTQAAPVIADYQSRRVPAYGLVQRDSTVRIYAGAFDTPDEAALFRAALKSTKNIDATLAYRVGRAY